MGDRRLRPGDVVEVRAPAEILATLDGEASVDAMPFMPEMLQYAGKRFRVSSRVEKICDTVSGEAPRSLRMQDTVLLDDLRCEGSAHGGCQAGCRLYWKEEWLRRVDPASESDGSESGDDHADALARLEALAREATVAAHGADGTSVETYRCQATEAVRASEPLKSYDVRQYVRELTSGNVGMLRLLRVAWRAISTALRRRLRLIGRLPLRHQEGPVPPKSELEPAIRRSGGGTLAGGDRAKHRRNRPDPRALVRLGDDPLLRRPLSGQGPRRAAHRRENGRDDRDLERLPDPGRRRLRGRMQHGALALSPGDLSLLA